MDICYSNASVRRQDRLLEQSGAMSLLKDGEYGVLCIAGADGAYGVPINYVWNSERAIYFHCAPQGEKLRRIEANPNVSFTVVGATKVLSNQFVSQYESVIVKGIIVRVLCDEERMSALEMLLDKYSPNDKQAGMRYAQKAFDKTTILRLDIVSASGKTKAAGESTK